MRGLIHKNFKVFAFVFLCAVAPAKAEDQTMMMGAMMAGQMAGAMSSIASANAQRAAAMAGYAAADRASARQAELSAYQIQAEMYRSHMQNQTDLRLQLNQSRFQTEMQAMSLGAQERMLRMRIESDDKTRSANYQLQWYALYLADQKRKDELEIAKLKLDNDMSKNGLTPAITQRNSAASLPVTRIMTASKLVGAAMAGPQLGVRAAAKPISRSPASVPVRSFRKSTPVPTPKANWPRHTPSSRAVVEAGHAVN